MVRSSKWEAELLFPWPILVIPSTAATKPKNSCSPGLPVCTISCDSVPGLHTVWLYIFHETASEEPTNPAGEWLIAAAGSVCDRLL